MGKVVTSDYGSALEELDKARHNPAQSRNLDGVYIKFFKQAAKMQVTVHIESKGKVMVQPIKKKNFSNTYIIHPFGIQSAPEQSVSNVPNPSIEDNILPKSPLPQEEERKDDCPVPLPAPATPRTMLIKRRPETNLNPEPNPMVLPAERKRTLKGLIKVQKRTEPQPVDGHPDFRIDVEVLVPDEDDDPERQSYYKGTITDIRTSADTGDSEILVTYAPPQADAAPDWYKPESAFLFKGWSSIFRKVTELGTKQNGESYQNIYWLKKKKRSF